MINNGNLVKLRDGLLKHYNVVSANFNMEVYRSSEPEVTVGEVMTPSHACGSVGCVVGWMPFLGVEEFAIKGEDLEVYFSSNYIKYGKYSNKHLFGAKDGKELTRNQELIWSFLFSDEWANHKGFDDLDSAIERINMVIEHGYDVFKLDNVHVQTFYTYIKENL